MSHPSVIKNFALSNLSAVSAIETEWEIDTIPKSNNRIESHLHKYLIAAHYVHKWTIRKSWTTFTCKSMNITYKIEDFNKCCWEYKAFRGHNLYSTINFREIFKNIKNKWAIWACNLM